MGKQYLIECSKGHKTKYIVNNEPALIVLCPQIVNEKPCKSECKIINEIDEISGELKTPNIYIDEMFEKFKEYYNNAIQKKELYNLQWICSTDNTVMIRKFDFDLDNVIKTIMNHSWRNLKNKELNEYEQYEYKSLETLLHSDKLITFTKIRITDIDKKENYVLNPDNHCAFSGYILDQVLSIFDNKCTVHIPDNIFLGYAQSLNGKYYGSNFVGGSLFL